MKNLNVLASLTGFVGLAWAQAPTVGNCTVFPADNIWNTKVLQLPVHPSSSTWVNTIGSTSHMHPDFGSGVSDGGPIGIPYVTVPGTQTKYSATFTYQDESDPGPYAIPLNAPIEGGSASTGDRHAIAVDTTNCILYEIYAAYPQASSWQGGSGAIFNLQSDVLRTASWTSADAAGLPIFPGLVRYDEIVAGVIRHAIRFTVPKSQNMYVWPARHEASSLTGSQYPPMGARFRLKNSFDISGYSATNQIILTALKVYGMILADNGSSWYISGAPDARWNNDDLHVLNNIAGSNFEAVDVSTLMVNPNSGQALQNSVSVGVSPPSASVAVNAQQQFTATVTGASNQAVTWDVNGAVGGNSAVGFIDSISGLYTAPSVIPSPAGVTVHAVSKAVSSAVGSASVTITAPAAVGPATVSVSPSSGSGSAQNFTFTFSDPNGGADIVSAQMDVGAALSVAGSCFFYYAVGTNALYLMDDTGVSHAALMPGSAGTAQNSQCAVNAGASTSSVSGTTLTLSLALSFQPGYAGAKNIYMEARNAALNSGWVQRGSWTVTGTSPAPDYALSLSPGSRSIAAGASTSYTVGVTGANGFGGTVSFSAAGLGAGATASFSPLTVTGTGTTTLTVNTSSLATTGTVTLTVTGSSGSLSHTTTAGLTITPSGAPSPPSAVSVSPSTGSGSGQTFTFTFSDPNGAANIVSTQMDVGATLAVSGSCFFYYAVGTNALYLMDDTGVSHAALTLGSAGTAQNSQCAVDAGASSRSLTGNTLTVNLALSFQAGYVGAKNIYMKAQNAALNSGWVQRGSWTVTAGGPPPPPTPPVAVSVSPGTGSGMTQTFAFTFTDPGGAANIVWTQIDVGGTLSVTGSCFFYYAAGTNAIYLMDDTGVSHAPLTLGSAGTAQNSQCAVDAGASSRSLSGNTLTLNLALSFQAGYAGAKHIYMNVHDASLGSGWVQRGAWTVP